MLREPRNILATPALKFDQQLVGTANAFGEGRVSHCPGDLNVSTLVSEVEHLTPDLDVGDVFAVIGLSLHPTLLSERRESRSSVVTKINPVTVADGLTRRAFDWNDLAGPAAPFPGDLCGAGEPSEEMVRRNSEVLNLTSGANIEIANAALHPAFDRLLHKNDSFLHALLSPHTPEQGTVWGAENGRKVNGAPLNRLALEAVN